MTLQGFFYPSLVVSFPKLNNPCDCPWLFSLIFPCFLFEMVWGGSRNWKEHPVWLYTISHDIIIFSVLFSFSFFLGFYFLFYLSWVLSWHFHWTIYNRPILKISFLCGKSNLRAHHLVCKIRIVFPHVHHCAFTYTDFICHFIITLFLLQFSCPCFYYLE